MRTHTTVESRWNIVCKVRNQSVNTSQHSISYRQQTSFGRHGKRKKKEYGSYQITQPRWKKKTDEYEVSG